jgi:hypothetical protein
MYQPHEEGGRKRWAVQAFFCIQSSETCALQSTHPRPGLLCYQPQQSVYPPSWQAQPDKGTAALEVTRKGRNS